jgi:hypothetical protein
MDISIKARGRKGEMVAVVTGKGMNGCCWWVRVFALLFWLKEEQFLCFWRVTGAIFFCNSLSFYRKGENLQRSLY